MDSRIWSPGWCPVCAILGDVLVLVRKDARHVPVFFCPSCQASWDRPPGEELGDFGRLADHAPSGVALPTEAEIRSALGAGLTGEWVEMSRLTGWVEIDFASERPLPDGQ